MSLKRAKRGLMQKQHLAISHNFSPFLLCTIVTTPATTVKEVKNDTTIPFHFPRHDSNHPVKELFLNSKPTSVFVNSAQAAKHFSLSPTYQVVLTTKSKLLILCLWHLGFLL